MANELTACLFAWYRAGLFLLEKTVLISKLTLDLSCYRIVALIPGANPLIEIVEPFVLPYDERLEYIPEEIAQALGVPLAHVEELVDREGLPINQGFNTFQVLPGVCLGPHVVVEEKRD